MYIHDSHVHTMYSHDAAKDSNGRIEAIIETAISRGVSEISLCDHYDIDGILDGIYPYHSEADRKADIYTAKEKYKDKIRINYGIELGQPHARKKEAAEFLAKNDFDFVIGSLHNLIGYADFYFLKLDLMGREQLDYLMRRTVNELYEIADFEGISTLAHVPYITRYLKQCGVDFDLKPYYNGFEKLFGLLIKKGIALEVNTSGLRRNSDTIPDRELCSLYRECGGELITIGSDAHSAVDAGSGIETAAKMLRELGFKSQCIVRGKKLCETEL